MSQSVCLNMIVKDEARVIRRCLESVRPFIQHWVIVDTGSSDGTQSLIRGALADLPGELFERPWKDFGHNRSEALALARGRADYILIMDADEVLEVPTGYVWPELGADQYLLAHRHASSPDVGWDLGTLVRGSLPWRYQGVLHEVIACDVPYDREPLPGPIVWGYFDSARNVDPVAKYANDARILERALLDDPGNARYVFYLGQSYRDSLQPEKALEAYARRARLGGWREEVFASLLEVAALKERLAHDQPSVVAAYLAAYDERPTRAEPLVELARLHRAAEKWALAELFARAAVAIERPPDILFVDGSVYDWRALDELAIASYYLGKCSDSLSLNQRLLSEGKLPARERARVEQNLGFAQRALGKSA